MASPAKSRQQRRASPLYLLVALPLAAIAYLAASQGGRWRAGTQAAGCPACPNTKLFYLFTMPELEQAEPWLAQCGLTIWASLAYQQLESSIWRTLDPAKASLWVFPPYGGIETNW